MSEKITETPVDTSFLFYCPDNDRMMMLEVTTGSDGHVYITKHEATRTTDSEPESCIGIPPHALPLFIHSLRASLESAGVVVPKYPSAF